MTTCKCGTPITNFQAEQTGNMCSDCAFAALRGDRDAAVAESARLAAENGRLRDVANVALRLTSPLADDGRFVRNALFAIAAQPAAGREKENRHD